MYFSVYLAAWTLFSYCSLFFFLTTTGLGARAFFLKCTAPELMLRRVKEGGGPSLKASPRWEAQLLHDTVYLSWGYRVAFCSYSSIDRSVAPFLYSLSITLVLRLATCPWSSYSSTAPV